MDADLSLPHHQARSRIDDARRCLARGEPRDALQLAEQARELAAGLGEPALLGAALDCVVRCAYFVGLMDLALKNSYPAIECWQRAADEPQQARATAMHAMLLTHLGRSEEGMDWAQRADALATRVADAGALAWAGTGLGLAHRLMGNFAEARREMARAVDQARLSGDEELLGRCMNNFAQTRFFEGNALDAAGQPEAARAAYEEALQRHLDTLALFRRLQYDHFVGLTLGNLGDDCFHLGRLDEAQALAEQSLVMARERRSGMHESHALLSLGKVQLARGWLHEARATLTRAAEVADAAQQHEFAKIARLRLSEACERLGDFAAALAHHKSYHAVYAQSASEAALVRARALVVHFETERAKAAAEYERLRAENLARDNVVLAREAEQLSRDVLQDPLTGLANRRRLDQTLAQLHADPAAAFSVVLLDLDHFKQVNDRYSHLVGDRVLQRIGALLREACRREDLAARFGGEEFALVLRGLDRAAALLACERLRAAIEAEPWAGLQPGLALTASIGLAARGEAADPGALLALADQRLYAAKSGGRNRVAA